MPIVQIETIADPRVADFRDVADPVRLRESKTFVAEGRFAVRRLLASGRFAVKALLVTDTALEALVGDLEARDDDLLIYVVSRTLMRQVGGYDFHQGCLGLAERPGPQDPAQVLRKVDLRRPIVVLERVGNPDNLGGIFRNAAAFGAGAVLLSPGCCDPLYRKTVRTSMAMSLQVPFAVIDDWPAGLAPIRDRRYELVALTPAPGARALTRYRRPDVGGVALLLGNEGDGLSPPVLAAADAQVRIVLEPWVDSLNVATASAVALHYLCAWDDFVPRPGT